MPTPPVARIHLSVESLTLAVGETAKVTATPQDAAGARVAAAVSFATTAPALLDVVRVGTGVAAVTARAPGTGVVDASAGGTSGLVAVTITAPAPVPAPAPTEPAPLPDPVIRVGPQTVVVRPGAPAGGDGSESAPFGSLDALHAAPHAHARVVLRGGTYPAGQSLRVKGGAADAWTHYVVPRGERAVIHGGVDPNGPAAVYGQGARYFAVTGDLRVRPDPRVPQQIRRLFFDRCRDFALDGPSVLGDYRPGDTSAAGSMGDSTLWGCEDFTLDRLTIDVVGSTPDTAGNGGDALILARGCRRGKVRHATIGRTGHTGITVIGGELLDGVPAPATEGIAITDAVCENTWTGFVNFNGDTRGCVVAGFTARGLGQQKTNALSRGGILVTGDGHHLHDGLLEDVYGTALQVQAYPFRGLLQHSRNHRLERITGRRIGGAALVLRVKGANNDPTPAAPDYDCELAGITADALDFTDVCRNAGEDSGWLFGVPYPVFADYYHGSDQAVARAGRDVPGSWLRNSRFTVAAPRVGALFYIAKQGTPSRSYATPADLVAAFPAWTGNRFTSAEAA